jgi:hypothetical protein
VGAPTADSHGRIAGVTQSPDPDASVAALDRALAHAVREVEMFVDEGGWDAPRQLFALVPTDELLAHEPGLLSQIGSDDADPSDPDLPRYTPVEQGEIPGDTVADALAKVAWPDEIHGCVLVLEIMTESGDHLAEGRLAVGVMRDRPAGACALRWRHAPNRPVTYSPDLAPDLVAALHATFEP